MFPALAFLFLFPHLQLSPSHQSARRPGASPSALRRTPCVSPQPATLRIASRRLGAKGIKAIYIQEHGGPASQRVWISFALCFSVLWFASAGFRFEHERSSGLGEVERPRSTTLALAAAAQPSGTPSPRPAPIQEPLPAMVPTAHLPPAALLPLLLLSTLPLALTQSCLPPNATGSLSLAGFQPPELGLNTTYTLSTTLATQSFPPNNSGLVQQAFYLTASPFVDLSAVTLPLTGCVLALAVAGSPSSTDAQAAGQGTCAGVLSDECQAALVAQANNASLANSGSGPSTAAGCAEYLTEMPMQCGGEALTVVAVAAPFGNGPPPASSACPASASAGNGSAMQAALIETASAPYSPATDTATYDIWVKQATPLVLTAWLKNGTGPEGWADTRLVCSTPDVVVRGSRVVSGGGRTVGRWGRWGAVLVGVGLGWGALG
ncbi:hypothetical protein MMC15_000502 [Xylographa vitiligo]|nr:hypothetical protein [Xylographa vitiligo]